MAVEPIRNPVEWSWDQLKHTGTVLASAGRSLRAHQAPPQVRRIDVADLKGVLRKGLEDFGAYRSDVIFLCIVYPIAGFVLARFAFGQDLLPLLFPLASGFALIGPVAAVGLYEMSRRREDGVEITWADAFGVIRAPAFGAILVLGLILLAIFLLWLAIAASAIYNVTPGLRRRRRPSPPSSRDVLTTDAGHGDDRCRLRRRFPLCARWPAGHQRGVVPAAARPRRRPRHGDRAPRVRAVAA